LSSSLQGVIAQTLLKRKGGEGRAAAFEVLVGTNAVRNLIRENQIPQMYSMIQTGSRYGMITMEDSIESLLDQGIVDEEEARAALMKATDEEGGDRDSGMASAAKGGASKKAQANAPMEDINADEGYSF
ncbi:MAG TPA: type IV pili twitching motility protein PilT, partial [Alphaproteobacteria bacterium]|nr:type IV pili twitching motility protein PilT [Alphaproteobacteria bacterium]